MRLVFLIAGLMLAVAAFGCALSDGPLAKSKLKNDERNGGPPASDRNREPLKLPLANPKIVVRKSKRQLALYSNESIVREYRIGLGLSPIEDKVEEGDRRTPEGEFYVFTKNSKSQFYLSLGISYPNIEDAARGLLAGLITQAEHDSIVKAIRNKKMPPQNTRLGGEIYIHGRGSSTDWTWGCVALDDVDMKELFDAIAVGTPVIIEQ